jgi:TonB family protein
MFELHEDRRSNRPELLLLVLLFCWFGLSAALQAQSQTPPKLKPGAAGPEYPEEARSRMVVGDVVFRAQVSESGKVESVTPIKVPEKNLGFEDAVKKTVMQWSFEPATKDGQPSAGMYVGKIGFSLRPDDEKALRDFVKKATEAWNKGDAKKLAGHVDKQDGRIHSDKELARSSKKIQKWLSEQLDGTYKKSDIKVTLDKMEFFPVNDLARITPSFTINHASQPGQEPIRGQFSVLLNKEGGNWKALSGQLVTMLGAHGIHGPKCIHEPDPDYPDKARRDRVQGTVVLEGTVDVEGKVKGIEVVRSVPELDQAAIDAVQTWKYEPATVGGVPTPMVTTITVNFLLE